jgi:hypothetical protein
MEIRTFTNFWTLERKLYTVYDFTLPFPISLRVLGVFVGTGTPWWLLMWLVQMPFSSPLYLVWILPPAAFAYFGSKPIFEGKTLFQYLRSRIQYLFENKNYKGLEPDLNKYGQTVVIQTSIITREPPQKLPFSR